MVDWILRYKSLILKRCSLLEMHVILCCDPYKTWTHGLLGPTDPIVINEINYHSSDEYNSGDWIELVNITDSSINISNWKIRDDDWTHIFEIPNEEILDAGDYVVICKDSILFRQIYPNTENFIGNINFGLSGSGDEVRIYNDQGNLIDSVHYSDAPPWPSDPDGNGSYISTGVYFINASWNTGFDTRKIICIK